MIRIARLLGSFEKEGNITEGTNARSPLRFEHGVRFENALCRKRIYSKRWSLSIHKKRDIKIRLGFGLKRNGLRPLEGRTLMIGVCRPCLHNHFEQCNNGVFMRIFTTLALSFLVLFSLGGCVSTEKIAVVEPAKLFEESEAGKAGTEHIKQIEASMRAQVQNAQALLEKSPNDEALRARFQKTFMDYQQLFNQEQQKVVTRLNEVIQKTLDEYRTQKGYTVIMNSAGLLSFDPATDVTAEVIAAMNKTSVAFEPIKLEPLQTENGSKNIDNGKASQEVNKDASSQKADESIEKKEESAPKK